DSEGSTVTYTSVYTDSEPGRVFWGTDEEEDKEEEDEEEEEEEEEEEHIASADSTAVIPIVELVSSPEG
ncbi:hypothetical protein Tco_0665760, partial [Tanacetum coccineum]